MVRTYAAALVLVSSAAMTGITLPARAGSFKVIYSFQGGSDGLGPQASLLNVNGTLYGTTTEGGSTTCDCGTVFTLNPSTGAEQVLHSFKGGSDGAIPFSGLTKVGDVLYGTTAADGTSNCDCGTVFSLNLKTGTFKTVYSFQGGSDGLSPSAGLIYVGGMLYGTTENGGVSANCGNLSCGTVFSVNPKTGVEQVIYAFQGGSDGANPLAGLINVGGMLYGTTYLGGSSTCQYSNGCGTVFSVNSATGAESVAYAFQTADGALPRAGLIDLSNILYGTTYAGGSEDGTVFSLNLSTGAEQVVYSFEGGNDASVPLAGLIKVGGNLYGTTASGGSVNCGGSTQGCGTIFSVNPKTGRDMVRYAFHDGSDGGNPVASLINVGGVLYGTATQGGGCTTNSNGCGVVFAFTP